MTLGPPPKVPRDSAHAAQLLDAPARVKLVGAPLPCPDVWWGLRVKEGDVSCSSMSFLTKSKVPLISVGNGNMVFLFPIIGFMIGVISGKKMF